jgi:2-polyprenyl-6-hydroxyphenyl methylase/3-demethylubiquinone-9 3-methyltransferase
MGGRAAIPARYERHPSALFGDAVRAQLRPGMAILDVGSGRRPALDPTERPPDCEYTGLDVSRRELELAPAGSYRGHVVADVTTPVAALRDRFDLIVSWQVLEHVSDTDRALANMRDYLRPGGRLVALLSGRFSAFGVINSAIPARLGVVLMHRLLRRDPDSVFPAHYDRCHARALQRSLASWTGARVEPIFQGGAYFNFALPLRRAYFAYEDWAWRSGRADLATHYLLICER